MKKAILTTTGRPYPFEVQFSSPQKYWKFFNDLVSGDEDDTIVSISFFNNGNRVTVCPKDVTALYYDKQDLNSRNGWEPVTLSIILTSRNYQLTVMGVKRAKNIYTELSALVGKKSFNRLFMLHQEENKKAVIRLDQPLKEIYIEKC